MMRVLVTGATGFLGRHVVPRLVEQRAQITAHGRGANPFDATVEYVTADLTDVQQAAKVLAPARWDAVIDLAGPVTGGNEDLQTGRDVVAAHVRIALNVRSLLAGTRIVHASSMTVYGPPDTLPVGEDHARRPQHLYGLAKMLAEDVLGDAAWIIRLPGLFSEHRASGALYHFCRAARAGEPLRVVATRPVVWDVLHVADAADALVRAASVVGTGAVNISYGEPVDLISIAQFLASHAGKGSTVETNDVDHPRFQLAIAKAQQLFAWQPPRLHDRLAQLYEAYAS